MTKPIRVLVVSETVHMWGAEQRILDTAKRLTADGFEMTLAAPSGGDLRKAWEHAEMPFLVFDVPPRRGLRRPGSDRRPPVSDLVSELASMVSNARAISRMAGRVDVIHSHSLNTNLETVLGARLARRPAVLDVHDIVRPGLGRTMLTTAALGSRTTIANSTATANTIGKVAHSKVVVIRPGVDTERFHPGPVVPKARQQLTSVVGEPLVGIVGRVDPGKGIEVLVRAVAKLNQRGMPAHLAVIGASTSANGWGDQLRRDAAALLGDRVRFVGAVDDVELVVRSIDVLVNASDNEPFGRSVLEAQASGIPVIAASAGGILEFVVDRETGLLVSPGAEEHLADALGTVLQDSVLREHLVGSALRQAVDTYSADAHAAAVGVVYRRACAGK